MYLTQWILIITFALGITLTEQSDDGKSSIGTAENTNYEYGESSAANPNGDSESSTDNAENPKLSKTRDERIDDCEAKDSKVNFDTSFVYFKEEKFSGRRLDQGYFEDLYNSALVATIDGVRVVNILYSPMDYCKYEKHQGDLPTCLEALNDFGFPHNNLGGEAFRTFYFYYVLDEITMETVYPIWNQTQLRLESSEDEYYTILNSKERFKLKVFIIRDYMKYFIQAFSKTSNTQFNSKKQYCRNVVT